VELRDRAVQVERLKNAEQQRRGQPKRHIGIYPGHESLAKRMLAVPIRVIDK
jgi:hypothetical protein